MTHLAVETVHQLACVRRNLSSYHYKITFLLLIMEPLLHLAEERVSLTLFHALDVALELVTVSYQLVA